MIAKDRLNCSRRFVLFSGAVCLLGACLCGCRSGMPEEFSLPVQDLVFVNDTDASMRDIILSIPILREQVTCSHVPPKGKRAMEFPLLEYEGNYVVVSWRHRGRMWRSEPEVALTPGDIDRRYPIQLVVTLGERGRMKVAITQPEARRRL